ncbi:hypothetical protein NW853_10890, partial [Synechococcus sp. H55.11]
STKTVWQGDWGSLGLRAGQRQAFHYKTAIQLLEKSDIIGFESLNMKGLARTGMAKSILDRGNFCLLSPTKK